MKSQNSVLKLDTPVGVIAVDHPLATRVFARHDIDFCCGGGKPLAEVCDKLGLDAAAVLSEIRREVETTNEPERRWDECPLENLIEYILDAYHRPLDEELPRLEAMARKVNDAHGEKDPERLAEILSVLVALKAELEAHMRKEERILFPMIRRGRGSMADETVSAMVHEHDSAGDALR